MWNLYTVSIGHAENLQSDPSKVVLLHSKRYRNVEGVVLKDLKPDGPLQGDWPTNSFCAIVAELFCFGYLDRREIKNYLSYVVNELVNLYKK